MFLKNKAENVEINTVGMIKSFKIPVVEDVTEEILKYQSICF